MQLYEAGISIPSDVIALRMAEATGQQIICYWHLLGKSRCARDVLPDIRRRTLPQAVLSLIVRIEDFQRGGLEDLKRLSMDGRISAEEVIAYGEAMQELREIVSAAYEVEYADPDPAEDP